MIAGDVREIVNDVVVALDGGGRQEDVAPEETEAFEIYFGADRVVRQDIEIEIPVLEFQLVDGAVAELVILRKQDAAVESVERAPARDGGERARRLILKTRLVELKRM